jgi:hypothetical protein
VTFSDATAAAARGVTVIQYASRVQFRGDELPPWTTGERGVV